MVPKHSAEVLSRVSKHYAWGPFYFLILILFLKIYFIQVQFFLKSKCRATDLF